MANVWVLVSTADPQWATIVNQSRARHRRALPRHRLSVTLNNAGTRALIKINGGDRNWRNGRAWMGRVIRVFTEKDHSEAQAMMYTPEWERPKFAGPVRIP